MVVGKDMPLLVSVFKNFLSSRNLGSVKYVLWFCCNESVVILDPKVLKKWISNYQCDWFYSLHLTTLSCPLLEVGSVVPFIIHKLLQSFGHCIKAHPMMQKLYLMHNYMYLLNAHVRCNHNHSKCKKWRLLILNLVS